MVESKQSEHKQLNALIFDFNGVLWWDKEIIEHAAQATFARLKSEHKLAAEFADRLHLTQDELDTYLHGVPNERFFFYLLGKKPTSSELKEFIRIKDGFYMEGCEAARKQGLLQLSPGAIDLLNYLKSKNIPITIATSSHLEDVNYFFKHLHLEQWFSRANVVYDDGSRPGKPNPAIYIEAAKRLKTLPQNCIVIEDAISGMIAADDAGIGFIIGLGPREKHTMFAKITNARTHKPMLGIVVANVGEVPRDLLQLSTNSSQAEAKLPIRSKL